MYAEVLVEIRSKAVDQTFTYIVPDTLKNKIAIGVRVFVPFGKNKIEGFVLNLTNENNSEFSMKEIIEVIDEVPILNKELLELGNYISKKTLCMKILCYQTMLPKALKANKNIQMQKKYQTFYTLTMDKEEALSKCTNQKQKEIIEKVSNTKALKKDLVEISSSALQTLQKKQMIKEQKEEIYRLNLENQPKTEEKTLTKEQQDVCEKIYPYLSTFHPFLLHGVTGSGKTEVYLHLIKEVLKQGKTALMLVPEISLTPQVTQIFQSRFSSNIALLHSNLSDGERYDEWRKIARGEVSIVIGARSAIFAPLKNIGIILVDEEHSSTYKQENNPKYYTLDLAIYRAKYHKCPVVFGSATPSMESYTRAKLGVYTLLTMKERVNKKLPKVTLVPMQPEIKKGNFLFSDFLIQKIEERLKKKEQILLLLNRRGYETVISCHQCGYTQKCPHCDVPLTYHKAEGKMQCHYCGYLTKKMVVCPSCSGTQIHSFGLGTQKLEEEVQKKFSARILRMDADSTRRKNAYQTMIQEFKDGKYDILIGTQMIAKGLDFPNVTLVGVLNADSTLNIPDFRSSERTFQLLSQVAGRAGRGHLEGEVIFQGFNMDHYSVVCASTHDYQTFYQKEMQIRKMLQYPPYINFALLQIISKDEKKAEQESNKIKQYLEKQNVGILLGPSMANLYKYQDRYHYQIIIKFKDTKKIVQPFSFLRGQYKQNRLVNLEIDMNPLKI